MNDYKELFETDIEYHDIVNHARDLESHYSERNREYEEYERMFTMRWNCDVARNNSQDTIKVTTSPTARNKVMGAWRLLISQEPKFHVRSDMISDSEIENIENFISGMWKRASGINGRPLHHDIILSMLLYGEAHIGVNTMLDYKELNPNDRRIDHFSKLSPIMFDVFNPKTGYPEFDKFGLSAYYRKVEVDNSFVRNNYAELIKRAGLESKFNRRGNNRCYLSTYYDLQYYAVWVDEKLLICREHGLPIIPVSVAMSDGSNLFDKAEDNREPLLYTLKRSKLWERENLYLTVTTSNLFSLGCMPLMTYTHEQGSELKIRNEHGMQFADIARGDQLDFVQSKGFLTNEMQNMGRMYTDYINQSTVFDNAFGESGGSGSFSETSLLSVSARLPLVASQKQCGQAIAGATELALMTMKERKISFKREGTEIKYSDIPDDMEIECRLDMTQPQERLQRANEGALILNNHLASKQWVQENTIGIENTGEMEQQIMNETVSDAYQAYKIAAWIQSLQQKDAQKQELEQAQLQQAIQGAQAAQQQAQEQQAAQVEMEANNPLPVMNPNPNQSITPNRPNGMTAGQEIESDLFRQIQNQRQMNRTNPENMPVMREGQADDFGGGGMAGGMPPEMAGMLPMTGGL